jgi:transcriptional regulator with XRE-family HTH domain
VVATYEEKPAAMSAFGRALEHELKERGLNQTDLARLMGLTSSAVSGWVTGAKFPSRGNAERIEKLLNIQPPGSLRRLLVAPESTDGLPLEHHIRSDDTIPEEDRFALLRIMRNIRLTSGDPESPGGVVETAEGHGEAGPDTVADPI